MNNTVNSTVAEDKKPAPQSRWKLYLVIAICASPLVFSYLAYYVIKPGGRTNYGTLLDPRDYPMPVLHSVLLGGPATELDAYKGKWIMLQVSSGNCLDTCKKTLTNMRQIRLIQGKDMDRIERVLLVTDQAPIETQLLREFDGTHILRADVKAVQGWLPVDAGSSVEDRLYLIDPLGNLMMRYSVDADPNKIKKDITKLLYASSIG